MKKLIYSFSLLGVSLLTSSCKNLHPQRLYSIGETVDLSVYKVKLTKATITNRNSSRPNNNLIEKGQITVTFELSDIKEDQAQLFDQYTFSIYADAHLYSFDKAKTEQEIINQFYTKVTLAFSNIPLDNETVNVKFNNVTFQLRKGINY